LPLNQNPPVLCGYFRWRATNRATWGRRTAKQAYTGAAGAKGGGD
jgi:hypothetical protein